MTDPESGTTSYVYDPLNRLTSLTNFQSQQFTFSYDALSRRTQLTRPNGVNTTYTYDNLSRLLSVLHQLGGNTIDGATYTVDPAGNRTAKTNHLNSQVSAFSYDPIYQLTQTNVNTATTETYTYDQVGNRLSSLGVSPYAYNNSNQLTSLPGVTYTYDNNGNTSTKNEAPGTSAYVWDFENRLTSVTLPNQSVVSFKYDPFGRRIQKLSGTATTIYVYDGAGIVEEVDASGEVVARYTQGLGIDEPLAMLRSGTTSYYHADGLGSITSLTDASGTVAASYTYDSFGNLTASTGSLNNPFRYTARELDPETGLYFYRARYYDQSTGRFLSEEPLRLFGAVALYVTPNFREGNAYSYVLNNPVRLVDPTGLQIRADTPDMRNATDLLDEMAEQGRRRRELGIRDPILDIFTPCFLKCMILGFVDDVAIGASSLASKKVRTALKTPTGLRCVKVGAIVVTVGAGVFCSRVCAKKVPPCINCSVDNGSS